MKLDPGMHIVMHLVFFGKTDVTTGKEAPRGCARGGGGGLRLGDLGQDHDDLHDHHHAKKFIS
jgi:hypothetical protein